MRQPSLFTWTALQIAVPQMRVYFTLGEAAGPDDDGVEFPDLEEAFREAGRAALRLASEMLDGSGEVRLNVYTDQGLVGSVTASLTATKGIAGYAP